MSHSSRNPPFAAAAETDFQTPRAAASSLSITALARFEFEAGKANDGTKILMIEWHDDDLARFSSSAGTGSWHVSWEGKKAVLPADEQTSESTRRVYFLLPPNVPIPAVVALCYEPVNGSPGGSLLLNPLPAIFPPELGATGTSAGKKGVLHTIWAKKRLQSLHREIRAECLHNVEGIALHMALQEKEWVVSNFGVAGKPEAGVDGEEEEGGDRGAPGSSLYPMGPTTPVSPTGAGKLGEKLKGLRLRTSERELSCLFPGLLGHCEMLMGYSAKYTVSPPPLSPVARCGCLIVYVVPRRPGPVPACVKSYLHYRSRQQDRCSAIPSRLHSPARHRLPRFCDDGIPRADVERGLGRGVVREGAESEVAGFAPESVFVRGGEVLLIPCIAPISDVYRMIPRVTNRREYTYSPFIPC